MQKSLGREIGIIIFKAVTVVVSIVLIIVSLNVLYEIDTLISDGTCNVAVFPLEGTILPFYGLVDAPLVVTPEAVETFFTDAEAEEGIEAILLEVNSPGGTPVAAERITKRVADSTVPVVGLIGDMAASGGYMVAVATDHLIASPMSLVGSIGVTMSYLEYSEQHEEEGVTFVELNTGKFKDAGSPDKSLTEEERALFERDLQDVNNTFIDIVSTYRKIPREAVEVLADGSTMTGGRALENKLIDGVGGRAEAKQALATILNKEVADIVFCEYESPLLF